MTITTPRMKNRAMLGNAPSDEHDLPQINSRPVNYFRRAVNALYTVNKVEILGIATSDPVVDLDTGDAIVQIEAPDTVTLMDGGYAENLRLDEGGNPITTSQATQRRLVNSVIGITLPFYGVSNSMKPRISRGNTVLFMGYYASKDTNTGVITAEKYHNMDYSMQKYVAKNVWGHPSLTNPTFGHHSVNDFEFVGFVRSVKEFSDSGGYGIIVTINYTTHRVLPGKFTEQPEYFDSETMLHEAHIYIHANKNIIGHSMMDINKGDIISSRCILKTNASSLIVAEAKTLRVIRRGARQ